MWDACELPLGALEFPQFRFIMKDLGTAIIKTQQLYKSL